jgi:hypothetical protein
MRLSLALSILLLLAITGCQQEQVSLRTWQDSVEHYVWDEANGDPAALRDLPTPGRWKGFSLISENNPASSTDINGVLLGHRTIGSKTYFIYLVGLVQQQKVQEIRLAALNASSDGFHWTYDRKDDGSLGVYRDFENARWRKLFPQRGDGPWSCTGFPCEGDVFKLTVSDGKITATHEQSGASWALEFPQGSSTTAPSVADSN